MPVCMQLEISTTDRTWTHNKVPEGFVLNTRLELQRTH